VDDGGGDLRFTVLHVSSVGNQIPCRVDCPSHAGGAGKLLLTLRAAGWGRRRVCAGATLMSIAQRGAFFAQMQAAPPSFRE